MRNLKSLSFNILLMALLIMPPLSESQSTKKVPEDPRDHRLNSGPKTVAEGKKVMVCTQSMIATEAALQALRDGGNAVDAAITAAFLQQVTEPHQVSCWGALSGVYYDAAANSYLAYNGESTNATLSSRVSIGGTVQSLWELHQRFGKRPWASNLEPAIAAAEEGV